MAQCMTPYTLKSGQTVPCGKCPACYKRRVNSWAFRLMQQDKVSRMAHFVTLTYAQESMHNNDHAYDRKGRIKRSVRVTDTGFMTLCKRDLQIFFKKLRRENEKLGNDRKINYYACGEYGSKTWRPHFHIILFNSLEKAIQDSWQLGIIDIQSINQAACRYTLKYMCKSARIPRFAGDDRTPEFAVMSKGIGADYLNGEAVRYHKQLWTQGGEYPELVAERYCITHEGGHKSALPRYYKEKLYHEAERAAIANAIQKAQVKKGSPPEMDDPDYFRNLYQSYEAAFSKFKSDEASRDKL